MNLEALLDKMQTRLQQPLPGSIAHEKIRARSVGQLIPKFEHKVPPKPGSVLILLYEEGGGIKFPLIKRSTYAGAHSAQVSFPGGKVEQGEDAFQAALREAEEEIGIDKSDVRVVGKLSNFNVIPSNFLVSPVVATIPYVPSFVPDPYEVEKIIKADLFELLHENAIQEKEILAAGIYPMMAPHFLIEDEIVWGATAMILNEFREVIQELNRG